MSPTKAETPAAPGWLRMDPADPRLLGTRCRDCGAYFFPPQTLACRNPDCGGSELEEVALSRRGRLWSYTDNRYPPPPPYVAPEPFLPYAIAAVELEEEKMVVLGQVAPGVAADELAVGMQMELVLGTIREDAESESVVWNWRPAE